MLEKQRQQRILDILEERQFASVVELTEQLNFSEATIRRDISKMAADKLLNKIRGGAQALSPMGGVPKKTTLTGSSFADDKQRYAGVKRLIAQRAVELCDDDEFIIINGGSSTYMMGEFLADRKLNILTNSYVLAYELIEHSENEVILPGGEVYRTQGIILSSFDQDSIQCYHGTKMFMGTPGIGPYGVMESDALLIRAEQKLQHQADQLIVLADSSKLGKRSNFIFTPLADVDTLITDSAADPAILREIESHGVRIEIVDATEVAGENGSPTPGSGEA